MAVFHVNTSYISKGGSASGFAQYLHRAAPAQASQMRRYIDREGRGHEDLIASGHEHLPSWANGDDHTFWLMADRHERKNGVVARVVELSLPRELSAQAQQDLADDIRQTFFHKHAHSWAIHAPAARDGSGGQPHLHVMFSPRADDGMDRSPQQHFRRYNRAHPELGGARKDPSWDTKGRLQDLRWGVATLINMGLERESQALAVSHKSLQAQGHNREPARYISPKDRAQVQAYRDVLHRDYRWWENECARAEWSQQKHREGIRDLTREAGIDHVRDHVWRFDRSPTRERQREQSLIRAIDREYTRTGRERTPVQTRERTLPRERTHEAALARTTRRLGHTLGHSREDVMGHGLQADLKRHNDDHEQGYSR